MGDAGEGLVDAEARIHERMDELERARKEREVTVVLNPEELRAVESLRLARIELSKQLEITTNERRRAQIGLALAEIDRRMK